MLFELNVSHIGVLPPEDLDQLAPDMIVQGTTGIEVRLLDGKAIIKAVKQGSSADGAGLRPGYEILRVGNQTIAQIVELTEFIPPNHDRNRRKRRIDSVFNKLIGKPGAKLELVYLDENAKSHSTTLEFRLRQTLKTDFLEGLPDVYVDFESKVLKSNIGYIRFNAFVPPVDQLFNKALESMPLIDGLIIDLRGNHGGAFPVRKAIAEKLVSGRTLFWRYKKRTGVSEVYLEPDGSNYQGPIVVFIDVMSIFSAEEFSGGLKAIKRATIIGERSPGIVLTMEIATLSNGAVLLYPSGETSTADGLVLENHGVMPDIEIKLDRDLLLQGIDSQLQAAISFID